MEASKRIAVTGATGRVGRHLVDVLEQRGHDVVPIARSVGVDVISGDGLDEALAGVDYVVDTATGPSPDEQQATEFFTTSAANLLAAGERAGVERIVVVSIVGCDRFSGGYNAAKVAQEQAIQAGPIAARILRATQFHEFVGQLVEWGTQGDVAQVPVFQTQLVAARSVAEALADLVMAPDWDSVATVTEIAGPRPENLAEMARLLVARNGNSLRVEEVRDPSDPDAELWATGGSLPGPDAALAGPAFEQWLKSAA
jgi:uncharacterized protein YbjT (DUF2867 family)